MIRSSIYKRIFRIKARNAWQAVLKSKEVIPDGQRLYENQYPELRQNHRDVLKMRYRSFWDILLFRYTWKVVVHYDFVDTRRII